MRLQALPAYYDTRHNGCQVPNQGFGGHPGVQKDSKVSIALLDSSGKPVTSFSNNKQYTVQVDSYESGLPVHLWIHASGGAQLLRLPAWLPHWCNRSSSLCERASRLRCSSVCRHSCHEQDNQLHMHQMKQSKRARNIPMFTILGTCALMRTEVAALPPASTPA